MKKYTKPMVVKVALNQEQAVLGTCSGAATKIGDGDWDGWCKGSCKQSTASAGSDELASS